MHPVTRSKLEFLQDALRVDRCLRLIPPITPTRVKIKSSSIDDKNLCVRCVGCNPSDSKAKVLLEIYPTYIMPTVYVKVLDKRDGLRYDFPEFLLGKTYINEDLTSVVQTEQDARFLCQAMQQKEMNYFTKHRLFHLEIVGILFRYVGVPDSMTDYMHKIRQSFKKKT
jgi:hypothetical protein